MTVPRNCSALLAQAHVVNLRKKIDFHERKSLIRIVRSCGYALDA